MLSFHTLSTALLFSFLSTLSAAQSCSDCITAYPLCDQTYLHFTIAKGIGKVADAARTPCFRNGENYGQAEENATWMYFQIKEAGQLSFIITPDTTSDDIDFVLFQLPTDGNCDHKKIVRCMAAGDRLDVENSPCMGQTGLYATEKDTQADAGCSDQGDNNWLRPLKAAIGEKYVLLVSNITAPHGFTIYFHGSALLEPCAVEKKE